MRGMVNRLAWGLAVVIAVGAWSPLWGQNDKTQANAYDDAWEATAGGWVESAQNRLRWATGKTTGFVLQVGDSITFSRPYWQWPPRALGLTGAAPAGATAEDLTLMNWINAGDGYPIGASPPASEITIKNGGYLCVADYTTPSRPRGLTAASGLDTVELSTGAGNGGTAMPAQTNPALAQALLLDGVAYPTNLHIITVSSAFNDAQFVVLMMGTNDMNNPSNTVAATLTNLTTIIDALEAEDIVVVLSTIPPNWDAAKDANVVSYNTGVTNLAQSRNLPLIDFYAEILARQPGTAWNGTLLITNDVHPTSGQNAPHTAASDPYSPGGDPATHTTGTACEQSGYLLRNWLTIQKLKEVKSLVLDPMPAAVAGLIATAGNQSVQLDWTAQAGATGYNVYCSTTSGSGYALVGSNVSTNTYTDSGLTNGTPYYYVVTAINGIEGFPSTEANGTPTGGGGAPPAASNSEGENGDCGCSSISGVIPGTVWLLVLLGALLLSLLRLRAPSL